MHSAKVLLGQTNSSAKEVDNKAGSIAAGLLVRLKSDGTISVALADGGILGVSLGKDLSDVGRTAIVRKGLLVPVLLTAAFTPTVGGQVNFSDTTGKAIASGAGATATNGTYATAILTGILEDGSEADIALIDMQGGL